MHAPGQYEQLSPETSPGYRYPHSAAMSRVFHALRLLAATRGIAALPHVSVGKRTDRVLSLDGTGSGMPLAQGSGDASVRRFGRPRSTFMPAMPSAISNRRSIIKGIGQPPDLRSG